MVFSVDVRVLTILVRMSSYIRFKFKIGKRLQQNGS